MAVITDVFVSTLVRTVFTKPPDVVRQYSPWPRAIVNFEVFNGSVSAKPVNDQLEMQIRVDLDPTFAYRLFDFNIGLIQDTAFDWDSNGFIELVDGVKNLPAGAVQRFHTLKINTTDSVATGESWIVRPSQYPHNVIQASGGRTVFFNFFSLNQNAAVGGAGSLNSLFRFWEYEIEQAEYFALHYAQMTYSHAAAG